MLATVKNFFAEIQLPSWRETVVLGLFLGVYMFGTAFTLNGDGSWGYAMIEKMHDPDAFAPNDIGITGSLRGNFLLYKSLYYLPGFYENFVPFDFAISTVITLLLILAWYNIFTVLSKRRWVVVVALFFLLFVDIRLSLGGTTLPLFYLSPISSVLFAQTFGFLFFLKKRPTLSFAIFALSTYLHPPSGCFFLAVFGLVLVAQAYLEKNWRQLIAPLVVAVTIFVPNIFILQNGLGEIGDSEKYFTIFRSLTGYNFGHIYIDSYPTAYFFTLAALAFLMVAWKKGYARIEQQRTLQLVVAAVFIVVGLWLVNLYFVHQLQVFFLYFAMRSTYLVKPLFIFFFSVVAMEWLGEGAVKKLLALVLLSTLIMPVVPGAIVIVSLTGIVAFSLDQHALVSRLNSRLSTSFVDIEKHRRLVAALAVMLLCIPTIIVFQNRFNNKLHKLNRLLHGENLFNFSFNKDIDYGLGRAYPEYGQVTTWAKQYKGKMFIIPLNDCKFSGAFRFITKNSIYISICDTFQLSFMPAEYYEGYDRLLELDLVIKDHGVFDFSGYNRLELSELKKKKADFVIFDKTTPGYWTRSEKPVYENKQYIIYSLK